MIALRGQQQAYLLKQEAERRSELKPKMDLRLVPSDGRTAGAWGPGTSALHGRFSPPPPRHWWRHLLFGADGDPRFKPLGGSRLEYKLDLKKLD